MCKVLKIRRSTYYKRLHHKPSNREIENKKLDEAIKEIYYASKKRYGAPKIQKVLLSKTIKVSLKRVQHRMTLLGIRSIVVKKYRHHSNSHVVIEQENLLKQDFSATTINQKWCTDITYIHTLRDGWTYLASVMDFYSKKVIGWAYGTSMTAELALKAVENACLNVKNTDGIILHSGLGAQYTSDLFESYLREHKIQHSFSRKGCPYDNACIESFRSLLKKEEVYTKHYLDSKEAFNAIFEYIESWYNHKRIHSSLNYQIPNAVHKAAQGVA